MPTPESTTSLQDTLYEDTSEDASEDAYDRLTFSYNIEEEPVLKIYMIAAINTEDDELVMPPTAFLAKSEDQAKMKATAILLDEHLDADGIDAIDWVIRPF